MLALPDLERHLWGAADLLRGFTTRGVFQKEYLAVSFREGWGDFVTDWAWNAGSNGEPEHVLTIWSDFDLDGDLDNYFSSSWHPYNMAYKLGSEPEIAVAVGGDSTDVWVNQINWLGAAIDESACGVVSSGCTMGTRDHMESFNRSTVYDVSNMFWALHNDDGLPADQLLQLYIDMCPRGWRELDYPDPMATTLCPDDHDLPYKRLLHAADEQAEHDTVYDQWEAHVLH